MKKYLFFIITFICSIPMLQAQNEDAIVKFFDRYMEAAEDGEDEDVTIVYISGRIFGMIADSDEDEEVQELIKNLTGLRIMSIDRDGTELYKEATEKFDKNQYESLMTIRDGGEKVDFFILEEGNIIKELLLLVSSKDSFVMISFLGEIDLDTISKLANSVDMDGMEHLDKIKDKEKKEN